MVNIMISQRSPGDDSKTLSSVFKIEALVIPSPKDPASGQTNPAFLSLRDPSEGKEENTENNT